MVILKLTTGVSVVVVLLQMTVVVATSLGMYRTCLYECLHCVNTWGKDLFDGQLCAENCALSGGNSIDRTCDSFFTRNARRVEASRQYLHSEDPSGRSQHGFSNGYSNGYLGARGFRARNFVSSRSKPSRMSSRSSLTTDCQRLCRTCESRYTADMDAQNCLYTCVTTRRKMVTC